MGFPIRRSPDQSLFNDSPELIAAGRVLRRLPAPRHPPYALSNLTIKFSQDKKAAISIVKELIYLSISPPGGYGLCLFVVATSAATKQSHHIPMRSPRFARDDHQRDGGADRDRTGDLRRAKPALSQLSYSPRPIRSARNMAREKWWA